MRLRNIKNKEEILKKSPYLIEEAMLHKGKWQEVFQNNNPIYIEIGMGKGKFIVENAKRYPEINFIGIERYDTVLARALPKIEEGIPNLRIIRINAIEIEKVFNHEIDCIFLNFSDPWPKSRHSNRRLMCKMFLQKYDSIFKAKKEIHMKTDNQKLFEFALESFSQYGYVLEEVHLDLHNSNVINNITTEYEDKFAKENKAIYHCVVSK